MNAHLALQFSDQTVFLCVAGWYAAVSLYTFISFARDKHAARRHRRRTPERHLHLLEFIGGFPGAWLAILLLRHKSRKPSFLLVSFVSSVFNILGVGFLIYLLMFANTT